MSAQKPVKLKAMDEFEQKIRDNAIEYNLVFFIPGQSARLNRSFLVLDEAIEYAKEQIPLITRVRSAMIYAIDKNEHHALQGTMGRNLIYKPVVPKAVK